MSGATWDVRTIDKVRRLWLDMTVSMYVPPDGHEVARRMAAESLKREAHTLAVEVYVEDVKFSARERADVHATTYRAYWSPSTRVVEFVGGASDGQLREVERVGDSVQMLKPPPMHTWVRPTEDALTAFEPISEVYELAGWREVERRWVYAVRAG